MKTWRTALMTVFGVGTFCAVFGAAVAPESPPSELSLVSPNGENTIRLVAGDETSGIWITHKGREDMVAIFVDGNGSAVGAYGGIKGASRYSGIAAGGSAPDGRLQLAVDDKPKVFSAADLE